MQKFVGKKVFFFLMKARQKKKKKKKKKEGQKTSQIISNQLDNDVSILLSEFIDCRSVGMT